MRFEGQLRALWPAQEDAELLQTALAHLGAVAVQAPGMLPQLLGPKVMALLEAQREVHPEVRKAVARALQAGLCSASAAPAGEPGPGQGVQVQSPTHDHALGLVHQSVVHCVVLCRVVLCPRMHEHHGSHQE